MIDRGGMALPCVQFLDRLIPRTRAAASKELPLPVAPSQDAETIQKRAGGDLARAEFSSTMLPPSRLETKPLARQTLSRV